VIKKIAKRVVGLFLRNYEVYRIYCCSKPPSGPPPALSDGLTCMRVTEDEISSAGRQAIREQAWYAGEGSAPYGCALNGDIVSVRFFWFGRRYAARGFIPLGDGEAKSVQLFTVPEFRGKRLARALVLFSTYDMMVNRGFSRLYSRIWFSNYPAIRVMESCGWEHISTVVTMQTRIWRKELRWTLPVRKRRVCDQ